MRAKRLQRAAAVLVGLCLLALAVPATASPDRTPARPEAGLGPALLQPLTAWLAGLWPGLAAAVPGGPTGLAGGLGPVADPDGEPAGSPPGPSATSDDDPTADPELGPILDPDG